MLRVALVSIYTVLDESVQTEMKRHPWSNLACYGQSHDKVTVPCAVFFMMDLSPDAVRVVTYNSVQVTYNSVQVTGRRDVWHARSPTREHTQTDD